MTCDGVCGTCNDDTSCEDACGVPYGDNSTCYGCTYAAATNYDSTATIDNGSCVYAVCDVTSDNQAVYDGAYAAGIASVVCPDGGSSCPGDLDNDGAVATTDLLIFLSAFGDTCEIADIPGCMDDTSCNYNAGATVDDASCDYALENFDCDGNCSEVEDCNGVCGGDAVVDECGVCGGDNSSCSDCCGVPNGDGSNCVGDCGACNDNSTCLDECGVPYGNNECFDSCGVPYGDNSLCADQCGVPNGDNSTCTDCCGVPNGDGSTCYGVCGPCGDDTTCEDLCGIWYGNNECLDLCGIPYGDNSSCELDQCGVPYGDNSLCADQCGVPNGNNECLDQCGVPNGDNSTCLDECGVPNGDNSTCADCAGVANGTSVVDECGTCDADASNDCFPNTLYMSWSGGNYYSEKFADITLTHTVRFIAGGIAEFPYPTDQVWVYDNDQNNPSLDYFPLPGASGNNGHWNNGQILTPQFGMPDFWVNAPGYSINDFPQNFPITLEGTATQSVYFNTWDRYDDSWDGTIWQFTDKPTSDPTHQVIFKSPTPNGGDQTSGSSWDGNPGRLEASYKLNWWNPAPLDAGSSHAADGPVLNDTNPLNPPFASP
jgi:hypothetical protein